jgi:hypothetical protein
MSAALAFVDGDWTSGSAGWGNDRGDDGRLVSSPPCRFAATLAAILTVGASGRKGPAADRAAIRRVAVAPRGIGLGIGHVGSAICRACRQAASASAGGTHPQAECSRVVFHHATQVAVAASSARAVFHGPWGHTSSAL